MSCTERESEEEIDGLPDSVEMTASDYRNPQGLRLRTFRFKSSSAPCTGRIFLCHGYGAHTLFEWFLPATPGARHSVWRGTVIESLVNAGFEVHALDHQSHGRSEGARGLRCFFEKFDDLPKEATAYIKDVVLRDAGGDSLPLFLLAISMGGATAIRMVQMEPSLYRGMVLYAPMISLQLVRMQKIACCITNGHLEPLAHTLSAYAPTLPVGKPARNEMHPTMQQEMDDDPLTYSGKVRCRVGAEFMMLTDGFMDGGLESVETPFIVFHGIEDTFTDPAGSAELFRTASATDKTYVRVGKGGDMDLNIWHSMTFEPGHEKIFERSLAWLAQH